MLADIQRTVYPEEVTRQLHAMAQARESSPVIDRRSNHYVTPPLNTICKFTYFLFVSCVTVRGVVR